MKIVVWNLKGGQGKTVLSMALAMLEGYYVVTNDVHSPIDEVIGEDRALRIGMDDPLPDIPDDLNIIYDFGGYPDARVIEAVKQSDVLIIPIIFASPLEMNVTLNAIKEIEYHTDKILIVLNKAKAGDLERAKLIFDEFNIHYPVFQVKESTVFSKALIEKKSLQELMDSSSLFSFHYAKPLEQVNAIIKAIS